MEAQYAICTLSMMPVRSEPTHRSEMVNMLLFGDVFRIEESANDWHRIASCLDDYKGWIICRKLSLADAVFRMKMENETPVYAGDVLGAGLHAEGNVQLSRGSRLPLYHEGQFYIGDKAYGYRGALIYQAETDRGEAIVQQAKAYLDTPYLWGGRSKFGIDCSGLTQMACLLSGVKLPRDAWQQAEQGEEVASLAEAQAGDLAFFAEKERISHVGVLTGDGHLIHSSGYVRMDKIDEQGIFNGEINRYTLPVKDIRRYI